MERRGIDVGVELGRREVGHARERRGMDIEEGEGGGERASDIRGTDVHS